MIRGGVIHIVSALIWLALQRGAVPSLITGLAGGFALLWLFRRVLGVEEYTRRVAGFFKFVAVLLRELVSANVALARAVVFRPLAEIHGGFVTYDVRGLAPLEIYVLAQCITLTPGTTTVEVDPLGRELLLHAFDAADPDKVRAGIDATLRKAILGFTR